MKWNEVKEWSGILVMAAVLCVILALTQGCHKNTVKLPGGETVQVAPGEVCREIGFKPGRTNLAGKGFSQVVEAIQLVRSTSGPLVVEGSGETLEMGLARANTVLGYLLEYGISGDRLRAESIVSSTDRVVIKNDVQTNWK